VQVKVGDLVMRNDRLVRDSLGAGIIVRVEEPGPIDCPFYQVKWLRGTVDLYWYDGPELEIISGNR
jgi:hypothetical protein